MKKLKILLAVGVLLTTSTKADEWDIDRYRHRMTDKETVLVMSPETTSKSISSRLVLKCG